MGYPSVIVLCVLFIGLAFNGPLLFYLYFAFSAFTTLSLIPPEAAGGINLLPQTLLFLCLLVKVMHQPGAISAAIRLVDDLGKFGILFAYLAVCFVVTIVAPRLFSGHIIVIPVRLDADFENVALAPTSTNLTQCAYLTISALAAVTFATLASKRNFVDRFATSLLIGGISVIGTGILDMVFADSGALAPFRNASYSILESAVENGVRRVIGLTPESSVYGGNCVFFAATLLFLRPAVSNLWIRLVIVPTTFALIAMAILSTSSTAYLWLAAVGACYLVDFGLRCLRATDASGAAAVRAELLFIVVLLSGVIGVLLFRDGVYDLVRVTLDDLLIQKKATESYLGRSFWNETSLSAFVSSMGLGVGVGSTRSSNTFVAVLSNTGVVGAALFSLFVLQLLLARGRDTNSNAAINGLKFTLISLALPWAVNGTSPDFGLNIGAVFGAIVGLMATGPARTSQRPASRRLTRPTEPSVGGLDPDCQPNPKAGHGEGKRGALGLALKAEAGHLNRGP